MADNVTVQTGQTSGLGGNETFAFDEIASVKYPRGKITLGADGTDDGDVSSSNPLPVTATDLATVAGAVSGSEMQVDIVSAPSLTVDLGVNNDVTAQGEDADGDPIAANPFVIAGDDSGNVKQITCSSSGALDVDLASTTFIDDTSTHSTGTTRVVGIGAVATPTDGTVGANDIGMPAMSTDRRLHTDARIVGQDADLTIADGGNSITVDSADLSTLAGAVSGSEMQVDIVSSAAVPVTDNSGSLTVDAPVGTPVNVQIGDGALQASVRNTGSSDSLNVAIVDGSGNQITSFGGSGGTAETDDGSFTAGSGSGTPIMAFVTSDTVDSGDVGVVAMDANRNMKVSLEVDNAGIGSSASTYVDDADWTATSSSHQLVGGVYQSTPGTITDGDTGPFRLTANGALHVEVQDVVSGGGTQFAADAALGTTPTGTVAIYQRDDALSSLTPTEGDGVPGRVDSTGAFWVRATNLTPNGDSMVDDTNDALQVNVVAGSAGGTEYTDDTSTHATGSSAGTLFMAAATPTDGSVDANDIGSVAMSTDRRLHVDSQIVGQDADLTIADGGNSITVDSADLSTIAGAVSGSEMQVDIVSSASLTVDLGVNNDVTVQGEDADGDPIAANPFVIAGDDSGNVKQLTCDSNGILDVNVNTGVFIDDTSTHSPNSTRVFGMGAVATPTDTTVNANDIGMPAMSTDRRLHTDTQIVGTDAALDVSAATVTVDNGGTFAVQVERCCSDCPATH